MTSPITGIAYARLSAPDLDVMQGFLEDFGMVKVHRDDQRLYMRGTGDSPFIHVTELGEAGTIAYAYDAADESVLHDFVKSGAAKAIETIDEPGGGKRVVLTDPNGLSIEVVSGRQKIAPLSPRVQLRASTSPSMRQAPSRVRRISHGVIATPKLNETIDWFNNTFKLIQSDELYIGTPENRLGMFSRIDLGEQPVDHHIVFIVRNEKAGGHHTSWEVDHPDEIFVGHDFLKRKNKYEHIRGIGRHALGCQVFDYWMSPFEQMHEHWSTSEQMNSSSSFNQHRVDSNMGHDHGEKPTQRFSKHASTFMPRAPR
jgi:catechol 2,3-dioxygenase-like lactoylglutathione lyase family enzyme